MAAARAYNSQGWLMQYPHGNETICPNAEQNAVACPEPLSQLAEAQGGRKADKLGQ